MYIIQYTYLYMQYERAHHVACAVEYPRGYQDGCFQPAFSTRINILIGSTINIFFVCTTKRAKLIRCNNKKGNVIMSYKIKLWLLLSLLLSFEFNVSVIFYYLSSKFRFTIMLQYMYKYKNYKFLKSSLFHHLVYILFKS